MFRGQRTMGTITAMDAKQWSVQTEDGKSVTIAIAPSTRFRHGWQQSKANDFKVGDRVMVVGDPEGEKGITARMIVAISEEQMRQVQQMQEGMGKQFIAGEVKGIDGTKLTILRPDGQTQVIEVDENTSFRKMRESITLADIKIGDQVFGRGELKEGTFVPTELNVGNPQRMQMMRPAQPAAPGPPPE